MLASDWASQVMLVVLACQCGDIRDAVSIPGPVRSSERGHGNPLQYSCLESLRTEEPGGLQSMRWQRVPTTKAGRQGSDYWDELDRIRCEW